ncbi:MAG: phosphopantetheine-binding protein, partial [Myxococcota bacterium]
IMRMGRAGIEPAICRSIFQGATIADLVEASMPAGPTPTEADPRAVKEAELQAIWREALGTDDIGLDESFYDLGGDSLTALGVIMRMGRAGIEPAICRSIFQGATIRDLVKAAVPETTGAASPPAASDALRLREAELAEIWKEALGTDDIAADESFYDLGGDSLTALNVIMRMGRAGIDPAICRSIFQGATIAELAKASIPSSEDTAATDTAATEAADAPKKKTIGGINVGYANNIMVNAVRGILILAVILGHWSIGLFDRLPESMSLIKKVMSPFFLFGTPGFAVTFGVGFGYLQLPIYERNPKRVKQSLRTGVLLVGSGAAMLGLLGAAAQVFVRKVPFDDHVFFVSFFTPLAFYAIAVASIPAWFSLITKLSKTPKERIRLLLGMAAASYSLQMVLDVVLADVEVRGLLQLLRLLLEAKFAYFDMMSLVFVGLALGTWIKHEGMRDDAPKLMAYAAAAVIGASFVFGLATGEIVELTYWPSSNCLTKWVFFAGLVMFTISGLMALTRRYSDLSPRGRTVLNALSTVGQLSLPFYILQSLPVPLKSVLQLVGVPGPLALLASLGLFAGVAYLMVRRVYAMFHN